MKRIYLSPPDVAPTDLAMLRAAFESGWIAPVGPHISRFESEMAERVAIPHAVALSSGTAALHLALLELGVGRGDEVFVSTFTFAASANVVAYVGATPFFVDSDSTWTMNPHLLEEELAMRSRSGTQPKAVIVVDIYGQCADYERIESICRKYNVHLIEDAAEALGASAAGRSAGAFGDFGIFSFNGNKMITTSGGGMVMTKSSAAADHIRRLASQARDPAPHYEHSEIGYNYRLSNLLAALGSSQLADLPRRVVRRQEVRARYRRALGDLPVRFQPETSYGTSACWLTCITIDPEQTDITPGHLISRLDERDIESRPTWKPMHLQPVFTGSPGRIDGTSERLFRTGLCLPSGSSLTEVDQDRVIDCLHAHLPTR